MEIKGLTLEQKMQKINAVSSCFCLAKWLQVTIDLVYGTTHSCHRPLRHQVPLDELKKNPGALHNTQYKMEQRKKMLEGERPAECSYCWEMEDSGSAYSDRIIKSSDPWSFSELERVKNLPWDTQVAPTYLEVMIDDICNFSCIYCIADVSTGVAKEIEKFGSYPMPVGQHRLPRHQKTEGPNPFVEAFWKWLPEIVESLKVLRITGGEPLLSQRFSELVEFLKTQKNPNLVFVVNSHLCHSEKRIDNFVDEISELISGQNVRGLEVYTSLDNFGSRAEYIRHGLKYDVVLKNIEKISVQLPTSKVVIMCTFNILSIGNFSKFIDDVAGLKKRGVNVSLDMSYLRDPEYLRADLATDDLKHELNGVLLKMVSLEPLFSAHEVKKIRNIITWINREIDVEFLKKCRTEFAIFIDEYDRRKGRRFLNVFPEYRKFYFTCAEALLDSIGERANLNLL